MTDAKLNLILEAAKKIERFSDYLYFYNKLRAEELKSEASFIRGIIEEELRGSDYMGQQE